MAAYRSSVPVVATRTNGYATGPAYRSYRPAGRSVEAAFRLPTPVAKGGRRTGLGVGREDSGAPVTPQLSCRRY